MQKHEENLVNRGNGNSLQPLSGVTVTVVDQATGLPASLYEDDEITPITSVVSDSNGYYSFKAADGKYTVTYSSVRIAVPESRELILEDPDDNPAASLAQLAAPGGSALSSHLPAGTGARSRTAQAKFREFISPADYTGFDATGVTDSTAAVQAAVVYAESIYRGSPIEIRFPSDAIVDVTQVFITTGGVKLNGNGAKIVQNHDSVNSVTIGGAGQYKVSTAFFVKRGAVDVEITGFDFTTDDASFPALAAGFGSYFASIAGQHFNRLNIHHNRFRGGQRRALLTQAGKGLRFTDNMLENNGFTIHIGYTANIYFYDSTADITNKYSPIAPYVVGNTCDGYSATDPVVCGFLTGAIRYTCRDNKFLNMTGATTIPLKLYSNDYGPYDEDGTALNVIEGTVAGNVVKGTFLTGIEVSGDSTSGIATWTNSLKMHVNVEGNQVSGTGHGIKIGEVANLRVKNNHCVVTGSPFYMQQRILYTTVTGNYFECTSSGQDSTTIFAGYLGTSFGLNFSDNRIISPAGSQYAMRATNAMTWLTINNNHWYYASSQASCRLMVMTIAGKGQIKGNVFNVEVVTASTFLLVLAGSGSAASLDIEGNDVLAVTGAGVATLSFANPYSFKSVRVVGNTTSGALLVETSDRVLVRDNIMVMPSGNTRRAVYCDNTGHAFRALVEVHGNYINQSAVLNAPCIGVASNNDATNNTIAKVSMNQCLGNSSTVLIQQTAHGVIEHIGNSITNAGAGGTTVGVTGSAVATAL